MFYNNDVPQQNPITARGGLSFQMQHPFVVEIILVKTFQFSKDMNEGGGEYLIGGISKIKVSFGANSE